MPMSKREEFESIREQCDRAWEQFNERRRFEFKVTLALWTALAAGIALTPRFAEILDSDGQSSEIFYIALWVAGLLVLGLHAWWCNGIGVAQSRDRSIALHFENILRRMSDAQLPEDRENAITKFRQDDEKRSNYIGHWAYIFQLGITALLLFILINALYMIS